MLEVISRTKVHWFTPSAGRDTGSKHARVELVSRSIESSLRAAEAERAGLVRKLEELTARALVPLGNGTDEYLTRDDRDNRRLSKLELEIRQAERSLEKLAHDIAHFEFLGTALKARFPDFRPSDNN